jgi:chorismate mutase/prephenate dehydratase
MDISQLRTEIDAIDNQMIELFKRRMDISARVADYKQQNGLPVLDAARERQKLAEITEIAGKDLGSYAFNLYSLLIEMSRAYQEKLLYPKSELRDQIKNAIETTDSLFTQQAVVACQGVEGAYSQQACEKLFKLPNIMYFNSWDGVFSAIENGLCRYGVLPLENSTAGSVNKIYDLMMRYHFSIVRSVRLKIDHNLLAKNGTTLSEIKEIFSHEQAINQSLDFIKKLGNVKVTTCENTAVAAQMVASSSRNDVAALSSRACADLYRLNVLEKSVQDQGNNYTRFICISKKLEIYPGADKTSIMMILPHKPGSLYKVLARFYALGINLVKLESRPLPERDFEFMFYFDLETSIYSDEFGELMSQLSELCEEFKYLGSYSELV